MSNLLDELEWRGLVYQVSDPDLGQHLATGPVAGYIGFDPTADSLHVGSLLQVLNLRRLQLAGHRPIALLGGGTGLIGDPSGRQTERNLLPDEEIEANVAGIRAQLERFLDVDGPTGALFVDNAAWLLPVRLTEFLRDVGKHFTVNGMIAKESVRARLHEREQGISFTEFSYMLLQAYDFLQLFDVHGCRLQMGGSDQWGNITAGIDFVRRVRGASVWGITSPLVTRSDGAKFGKSEGANVWLDPARTSPYQLYQYFVRTEDRDVGRFLRYFTFLDRQQLAELDALTAAKPERREAQRVLAREVTALVHGEAEAAAAQRAAEVLFSEDIAGLDEDTLLEVVAEAPSTAAPVSALEGPGASLVDLLVQTGLSPSKRAARQAIEQGGAYLNNRRVSPSDVERRVSKDHLLHGRYVLLRRGRREQHLLRYE